LIYRGLAPWEGYHTLDFTEVTTETVFYVGMDVHKESIQLAVLRNGQVRSELEQRLSYDFSKVRKLFGSLKRAGTVFAAYEKDAALLCPQEAGGGRRPF
jgi:hypothetical protein